MRNKDEINTDQGLGAGEDLTIEGQHEEIGGNDHCILMLVAVVTLLFPFVKSSGAEHKKSKFYCMQIKNKQIHFKYLKIFG